MASPSMTFNAAANALSSASLAAAGTVTFNLDFSTKFEGHIQVKNTGGGTVAATNGLQIDVFPAVDTGPDYDTVSAYTTVIATVTSTTNYATIKVPTGKYQVKLTNLDPTNAVTRAAQTATIDAVS